MRPVLAIALAALTLCGCMAEWKSPRSGPRFKDGPSINANNDSGGSAMTGQGNGPQGPGPGNY